MLLLSLLFAAIPLLYILEEHREAKRERADQLRQIDRRLAEKAAESETSSKK